MIKFLVVVACLLFALAIAGEIGELVFIQKNVGGVLPMCAGIVVLLIVGGIALGEMTNE